MSIFERTAPLGRALLGLALASLLAGAAGAAAAQGGKARSGEHGGASALGNIGSSREPISIDADRLDVYDKEGRAVFTGNVVAVQGETNMRCSEMNVFYESKRDKKGEPAPAGGSPASSGTSGGTGTSGSPGGLAQDSAIKKILCKGPVVIKTKTQTATGDRAEFDRVINKVFLIGNATLSDGPNVTRGERVAYDLNTQIANIEGGRVRALIVPGSTSDDKGKGKEKPKGR